MTNETYARLSGSAPDPDYIDNGDHKVRYTCHLAAMHWGFMDLGKSQAEAHEIIGRISKLFCSTCEDVKKQALAHKSTLQTLHDRLVGRSALRFDVGKMHGSLLPEQYSKLFCRRARRIERRADLFASTRVGDVLIYGSIDMPAHSMVVSSRADQDRVTVRGYNNYGTLREGPPNAYDPHSRNIAQRQYWVRETEGIFRGGFSLFVIRHEDFMMTIRYLASRTGPHMLRDGLRRF